MLNRSLSQQQQARRRLSPPRRSSLDRCRNQTQPVRLSVCIDMILTEIPSSSDDRIKRSAIRRFEFWEWKKRRDAILRKKNELGLE